MLDIKYLQQQLLEKKVALLETEDSGKQASEIVELDQSKVGRLSRMDAMQQQAMSKATNERRNIQLQQIDSALKRIESGEYGDCLSCGEEIAEPRLELNPAVTLCIDCANKIDSV